MVCNPNYMATTRCKPNHKRYSRTSASGHLQLAKSRPKDGTNGTISFICGILNMIQMRNKLTEKTNLWLPKGKGGGGRVN